MMISDMIDMTDMIDDIFNFQHKEWNNLITPAFFGQRVYRHSSQHTRFDKYVPATSVGTPYTSLSEFGDRIATTVCIPVAGVQDTILKGINALQYALSAIRCLMRLDLQNGFIFLKRSVTFLLTAAVTLVVTAALTAWQLFATLFKLLPTVANMMKPGAAAGDVSDDETFDETLNF